MSGAERRGEDIRAATRAGGGTWSLPREHKREARPSDGVFSPVGSDRIGSDRIRSDQATHGVFSPVAANMSLPAFVQPSSATGARPASKRERRRARGLRR